MADEKPIRFTLPDETNVIVRKVLNNKYDFELTLPNGNRKTFIWFIDKDELSNLKENKDRLVNESIVKFVHF